MRITELKIDNVKRINAVHIKPVGSLIQITGRNGQGKSSVLDSVAYALGGKDLIPEQPLRRGAKKAKVSVNLGDIVVTRTFTEGGGGQLTVESTDGARYQSPQAMLDKLVGNLTLDPLAFSRMPAKQQAETLKKLVGLDFSTLDQERAQVYAERTRVNKAAQTAEAALPMIPKFDDAPADEVSVADLIKDRDVMARANAENAKIRQRIEECDRMIQHFSTEATRVNNWFDSHADNLKAAIKNADDELERAIASLRQQHKQKVNALNAQAEREVASKLEERKEITASVKEFVDEKNTLKAGEDFDLSDITQQIQNAEATNKQVRANRHYQTSEKAAADLRNQADALTNRLAAIDESKADQLAAAKFPIPGLSFDDTGVVFNELPFSQASSAEQLRASVAICLAMNPKLRVLLIRDGSLLDNDGLAMLESLLEEHDAQCFIERVGGDGKVGIVIEDGSVALAEVEESVVA